MSEVLEHCRKKVLYLCPELPSPEMFIPWLGGIRPTGATSNKQRQHLKKNGFRWNKRGMWVKDELQTHKNP